MSDSLGLSQFWVEADLLAFSPSPQAAPESFEEYLQFNQLDDFDGNVQVPATLDDFSPAFRDFTPSLVSPSGSAYLTECSEDPVKSEYSVIHPTPKYPASIDSDGVGLGFEVDTKHDSVSSAVDWLAFLDSFEPDQLSLSSFELSLHVQAAKAQYDDALCSPPVGISPHSLSTAYQSPPPPAVPKDPSDYTASTTQSRTGPIRGKYECRYCGHKSARKHNLKTHEDTHNTERIKPYVCPEMDCGHPFTRKHDLKRHLECIHGGRAKCFE